ncbi:MAG: YgiQ family radical SAM protein [Deltaproteobacteria bacterium]|nr:YgiQ family radical SAM protein [Deltaproteobacteria bacterium]
MSSFDVIFVLPYPFSDHPFFPEGILRKALQIEGYRVGIIETPFGQEKESFAVHGKPRLFFAVISGPVDSVVLNYTSSRKRRGEDLYQFGGKAYFDGYPPSIKYKIRPDRTTIVFTNKLKELFHNVPIVIGGLEAALRCFAHYDFQQDKIRRSVLLDSKADLLVTGMGEKQLVAIARAIDSGRSSDTLILPGTARVTKESPEQSSIVELPSFEAVLEDRKNLLKAHLTLERALLEGKGAVQKHGDRCVVQYAPQDYSPSDLDHIYDQHYTRMHLGKKPYSPALRMNLFSITSHRGCGGGCSFCSIEAHQGKKVISRSVESIIKEIRSLNRHPEWKGTISDIGGATAEMYGNDCDAEACPRPSCLYPKRCRTFSPGERYLQLLRDCRRIPGVKKILLGSGIRYDVLLDNPELLEEILIYHSGRSLRIAPEHTEDSVLTLMRKPPFKALESFVSLFNSINGRLKRKIELAPYLIVGHPGEKRGDMVEMKKKLKSLGMKSTDVQIFTPTPGTLSTAMFYAECDLSFKPIPVEKTVRDLMERKRLLPP